MEAKKPKFCQNGTPDEFNFGISETGIGHNGVIGTKISPLSAILLKSRAKMQFGGQKRQNFAKTAPLTNFNLVILGRAQGILGGKELTLAP